MRPKANVVTVYIRNLVSYTEFMTSAENAAKPAVAYRLEQSEKLRVLKAQVDEGMQDIDAGRTAEWNFGDFLRRARQAAK
jgi:hypothetical protein